jgi:guanylate kinase
MATAGASSSPVDLSDLDGVDLYGDGADDEEDGGDETLTYLACSEGNLAALRFVLEERTKEKDHQDADGYTPLYIASKNGHLAVVKYLVEEQHVNFELSDNNGATPLYVACFHGHVEVARYLLDHGAFEAADNDGLTPLYVACKNQHMEVLRELCERRFLSANSGGHVVGPVDSVELQARQAQCDKLSKMLESKLEESTRMKLQIQQMQLLLQQKDDMHAAKMASLKTELAEAKLCAVTPPDPSAAANGATDVEIGGAENFDKIMLQMHNWLRAEHSKQQSRSTQLEVLAEIQDRMPYPTTPLQWKSRGHLVPAAKEFELRLPMAAEGTQITYKYWAEGSADIGFRVFRGDNQQPLNSYLRAAANESQPTSGVVGIPAGVVPVLRWDNTYSWITEKKLSYEVKMCVPVDVTAVRSCLKEKDEIVEGAIEAVAESSKYVADLRQTWRGAAIGAAKLRHTLLTIWGKNALLRSKCEELGYGKDLDLSKVGLTEAMNSVISTPNAPPENDSPGAISDVTHDLETQAAVLAVSSTPVSTPSAASNGFVFVEANAGATLPNDTAAANGTAPLMKPLLISGPSGCGKGTMIAKLMKNFPELFGFSVSHTTRPPRPGEIDGKDYHFSTREEVLAQVQQGLFLEHADVHGKIYGTSMKSVSDVLQKGKVCIIEIDTQGAKSVKGSSLNPQPNYLFIEPPSMAELESRLRGRGTEKEEDIVKRIANAQGEMDYGRSDGAFDKLLKNDDLERAYAELVTQLVVWYPHLKVRAKFLQEQQGEWLLPIQNGAPPAAPAAPAPDVFALVNDTPAPAPAPAPAGTGMDAANWEMSNDSAAATEAPARLAFAREQLVSFYEKHDSSRIHLVERILGEFPLDELADILVKKYGESPLFKADVAPARAPASNLPPV